MLIGNKDATIREKSDEIEIAAKIAHSFHGQTI